LPWLPDVPTFAELGYGDFDALTFTGLFAPAGTPQPVIDKLQTAMVAILKDAGVIEKFDKLGAQAVAMTPAEFTAYLTREDAKWLPVVRKANIKAD
jgi:tripartite-type tricarboxylate transporter receptor subunit TctC